MTPEIRTIVITRAGYACEKCKGPLTNWDGMSVHHRKPRGMGGSKNADRPENLLALCGSGVTGCHGWVEKHRDEAYTRGLLLRTGYSPYTTPFRDDLGDWWLLFEDRRALVTPPSTMTI